MVVWCSLVVLWKVFASATLEDSNHSLCSAEHTGPRKPGDVCSERPSGCATASSWGSPARAAPARRAVSGSKNNVPQNNLGERSKIDPTSWEGFSLWPPIWGFQEAKVVFGCYVLPRSDTCAGRWRNTMTWSSCRWRRATAWIVARQAEGWKTPTTVQKIALLLRFGNMDESKKLWFRFLIKPIGSPD